MLNVQFKVNASEGIMYSNVILSSTHLSAKSMYDVAVLCDCSFDLFKSVDIHHISSRATLADQHLCDSSVSSLLLWNDVALKFFVSITRI